MDSYLIDSLWVLMCAALVFAMQSGFLCLESGLTRSKNAINVAIKNMTDFAVSLLLFWAIGFALMFGTSLAGWIGTDYFFTPLGQQGGQLATFFIFQAMFCATAATIVSGAVAERMRFSSYIIVTFVVSAVAYPVFGHWAWGGTFTGPQGWLAANGFVDFAGSTVVHSVGGWAALAAVLVIGPRIGQFDTDVKGEKRTRGSNLPFAMLGAMLLWFGWIGFNGGSTLAFDDRVAGIVCNTFLAGAAGMTTALAVSWYFTKHANVCQAINGSLAGLVAITAGCHAVTTLSAVIIGAIGALVMLGAQWIMNRFRVDDAVSAVPVHAGAGAWGTIAVALFGIPEVLGTELPFWTQLQIQLLGVCAAFTFTFGVVYVSLRLISSIFTLRVTAEQERIGLNISEHGSSTELFELLTEMELQRHSGNFTTRVTGEAGSEVGQIAAQYNRVLDKVAAESDSTKQMANEADFARQQAEQARCELEERVAEREKLQDELMTASRRAGMAEVATGVLHNVGNVLNSVNVSAGVIQDKVRGSSALSLTKAVSIMEQQLDDLGRYVTQDERGKHLPRFLIDVSRQIAGDEEMILEEINSLIGNIDHIKTIVGMQQSHAKRVSGVNEEVSLADLLENAIRINVASMKRNSVQVVRKFEEIAPVLLDKQKFVQIVVNLISNANNACIESGNDDQRMTVSLRRTGDDRLSIEVRDNGIGIAAENFVRIFAHGFTTRKEGHGFGLHSSALAAEELNGSLTAYSDGPGTGATFTLDIPYNQPRVSRCTT